MKLQQLLVSLLCLAAISAQSLTIFYASTSPTSVSSTLSGSLRGGTMLYIKVIGHNPMANMNNILVGNYPCIIPSDGVTTTFISCVTTDPGSQYDLKNQVITIMANDQTATAPTKFSYLGSSTPILQEIYPVAGYALENINFYGLPRITDLGNGRNFGSVGNLMIGNDLCSRFDIFQAPLGDTSTWASINCIQSSTQEAGYYRVSQLLAPGYAQHYWRMTLSSFNSGEQFEYAVLPKITSMTPSQGSIGGQIVTIKGSGFSNVISKNKINFSGTDCVVTAATHTQITCTMQPQNTAAPSQLLPTNAASQSFGYTAEPGLAYKRYDLSGFSSKQPAALYAALKAGNMAGLTTQEEGVRASLKAGDYYGSAYAQVYTGYFKAPTTGTYTFNSQADDAFALYLSTSYGSYDDAAPILLHTSSYQSGYPYFDGMSSAVNTVALQADKAYYLQAIHINGGGGGWFRVAASIPNTDTTLSYQTHAVHKIDISSTVQPQVVVFNSTGATKGSINLTMTLQDQKTLAVTYFMTASFPWNASPSQFCGAINQFNNFGPFQTTCSRTLLDTNGVVTTVVASAVTYQWTANLYLLRTAAKAAQKFVMLSAGGYDGTFNYATVTQHSPLMTGTFGMTIGGYPVGLYNSSTSSYSTVALPYNIQAGDLQSALRGINGFQKTQVVQSCPLGSGYGITFFVYFYGVNQAIPLIEFTTTLLLGGTNAPTITDTEVQAYSPNLYFDPVDFRFLTVASETPTVTVTVNNLPATCKGACGFTFVDVSRITQLSLNTATGIVSLGLSDTNAQGFTLLDVTVTIEGKPCRILDTSALISAFTCTVPVNSDGTAQITAGNPATVVTINSLGIIPLADGVAPITVPLVLSTVSPAAGADNGGYFATLTGNGFPTDATKITVSVCNSIASISSISNQQIVVFMPSCDTDGETSLTVTYNNLPPQTVTFTYQVAAAPPTITAVSPASSNPTWKTTLTITGTSFGSDIAVCKVFLANATGKVYPLKVLSLSDTTIRAGLSGGYPGNYIVQVTIGTIGDAVVGSVGANSFSYSIIVSSVTPQTGSNYGGTLITLTGTNFLPDTTLTTVYIGDDHNQFCRIETITSTTITCRTPKISPLYQADTVLPVYTSSRLIVDSTCDTSSVCHFTYATAAASPALLTISATSAGSAANVTVTGTLLASGASTCTIVLTNLITQAITPVRAQACNDTVATFSVPNVEAGSYSVKVRTDPKGQSNPLMFSVLLTLGTTPTYSVSTQGGQCTFTGTGYPSNLPSSLFPITLTTNGALVPVKITSVTSTTLTVFIPRGIDGQTYTFTMASPVTGNTFLKTFTLKKTSTPTMTLTSASSVAAGSISVSLNRTNLATVLPSSITLVSKINPNDVIIVTANSWTNTTTVINFNVVVKSGLYGFVVAYPNYGIASITATLTVTSAALTLAGPVTTSFNGGSLTITGAGMSPSGYITVNGLRGNILSANDAGTTFTIPTLVTDATLQTFNFATPSNLPMGQFTFISDTLPNSNVQNAFDGNLQSTYVSTNPQCFLGVDAGQGLTFKLSKIRYFGSTLWANTAQYILDSKFQGSNDNTVWTTLGTIDQTTHSGWNTIMLESTVPSYRYIRFLSNSTSKCSLAEMQLNGLLLSTLTITNLDQFPSDVVYNDGVNTQNFSGAVLYRQTYTPVVTNVSPMYGTAFGEDVLTITGTNLNAVSPTVTIDGIDCLVSSSTLTQITCTTGSRLTLPTKTSFTVKVGNGIAVIQKSFQYVLRWSDPRTWGTDLPPVDGDLVSVPLGMTLLVDQSTPKLEAILVNNGSLVFADEKDMTVTAGFITVIGGSFTAGTQDVPYQHQLSFVMTGIYEGSQQPMFGNKGIGCIECAFSMHGTPRPTTWTLLSTSISAGSRIFTVMDAIDWAAGEVIVVASSSFDHNEAERRTIEYVSDKTVTVTQPFKYDHFSGVETFGTDSITMRAEVGLLTRNIKMMGDSNSTQWQYGSHLMLTGSAENGLVGHVAYSQFSQCGQPRILGRYCIHFHMAGDVPNSYVRGNAVHDSFARVVTLHGVFFLLVQHNVGYRVQGHNFFVEDGIETHNVIQYNLAIGSLSVSTMLQTDISVASFWITNPTNDFRYNHAAGGDFYGLWYQIKPNPDGPSATNDVCPMGNPLGNVHDNVGHSNVRFGFRLFTLAARTYPCLPIRNNSDPNDPWQYNPSILSKFSNFTLYKNGESGALVENSGNCVFDNFTIAESVISSATFHTSNMTKEKTTLSNSVLIGMSTQVHDNNSSKYNGKGIISPRAGDLVLSHVNFYSFGERQTILSTCTDCGNLLLLDTVGQYIFTDNLKFTNILGHYLTMQGIKREIIYDKDGTFASQADSTVRTAATITADWKHLTENPVCVRPAVPDKWDNGVICDQSVIVRKIMFTNLLPVASFFNIPIKIKTLTTTGDLVSPTETLFSSAKATLQNIQTLYGDKPGSYAVPFITGSTYSIWWGNGVDFTHLSIVPSPLFTTADKGVLFKFNYTANRELFEVGSVNGGKPVTASNLFSEQLNPPDPTTCNNGDYYHNNANDSTRAMYICTSGKNKTLFTYTDITGIVCRYLCPAPASEFVKESFLRQWSNATQWPNGVLPRAGEDVYINGNWTLFLDIDPAPAGTITIDGSLRVNDNRDVQITAKNIFVRAGDVQFGTPTAAFTHKVTITLTGGKSDVPIVIDPSLSVSKSLVNTGSLSLYGVVPGSVITKLTSSASVGATIINVADANGWNIGDQIVLSPSYSNVGESEVVTITAINNKAITFTPALLYGHFGASGVTITNSAGSVDARTSVGHLTRNIVIKAGSDETWGFTFINYGFRDGSKLRVGQLIVNGVQFIKGSQKGTPMPAMLFMNNIADSTSKIAGSSFMNCFGLCLNIQNSNNVQIQNNVFSNVYQMAVTFSTITNVVFSSNLMTNIWSDNTIITACVGFYEHVTPVTDGVYITNNWCHGSTMHAYVFPYIDCADVDINPFANNTAGSSTVGFIFNKVSGTCIAFSWASAFACNIGQLATAPPTTLFQNFTHFVMIDNARGVTLRFGGGSSNDYTAYLTNSFISAVSRPSCIQCYATGAIDCANNQAMRMLSVTVNGQHLPQMFGAGLDVICNSQTIDAKSYISNVIFDNYRINYTAAGTSKCKNNVIFRPHPIAHDQVGSHHLFNTTCQNCQPAAFAICDHPEDSELGWFGGCGEIYCTGKNNYLIHDHTGLMFGSPGVIIPNNTAIGSNTIGCTFYPEMNGHLCQREDFAVLEFQNVAADAKKRQMWPVYLSPVGGSWTNVVNGFREWTWIGSEPQNTRQGNFISIVQLQQTYNLTFASMPPLDMMMQIQKRLPNGNASDWVIMKLTYPLPNSIQVKNNGVIVPPITITGQEGDLDTTLCGSNKFFYKNYTIHFVVTGDPNCKVQISLINTIQLTAHFDIAFSDFFTNNGQSLFVDRICALLKITDYSRVKVVSIFNGSIGIVTYVDEAASSDTTAPSLSQTHADLAAMSKNGVLASSFANTPLASINSITPIMVTLPDPSPNPIPPNPSPTVVEHSNVALIIGVTLSSMAIVAAALGVGLYCLRKRAAVVQSAHLQSMQEDSREPPKDELKFQGDALDNINFNGESQIKIARQPEVILVHPTED